MYSRVASQLIGSAETFAAARELACVRLLSGVCSNVSCLMFESVEGSVAQRALVGAREVLAFFYSARLGSNDRSHAAG